MPGTVSMNKELGVIEVSSFGDVTPDDIFDNTLAVEKMREKNGVDKVLLDVRKQSSTAGMTDIFRIASEVPLSMKLAVVLSEGQPTEEDNRFFETMANSCGASVQTFPSKDEAVEWLNQ